MEWSLEKDDMVCVQKSAYVHANNVLKILFAGGHLICLNLFLLVVIEHLGACEEYRRLSLSDCQKGKQVLARANTWSPWSQSLLLADSCANTARQQFVYCFSLPLERYSRADRARFQFSLFSYDCFLQIIIHSSC